MTHDAAMAVMAIGICGSIAVTVSSIVNAAVRYAEGRRSHQPARDSASDERLARLEVAVESIAVEIERISEGQRFTTRLLNDQLQTPVARLERPARINTPH